MPGPGAYSDKFELYSNNGFSLGKEKRMDMAYSNNNTAPGDYNPRYGSIEPNIKKTKFGTETRLSKKKHFLIKF